MFYAHLHAFCSKGMYILYHFLILREIRLFSFFPDIHLSLQTMLQCCVHLPGQSCRSLQCPGVCSTDHMG